MPCLPKIPQMYRVGICRRVSRNEPDDCNDEPYFEDFTATLRIYEDSDALVPLASQMNPREATWKPGQTTSNLNLEVNKVDHFSQANHPTVRRQIEATIRGTSSNLERVVKAFFVEP